MKNGKINKVLVLWLLGFTWGRIWWQNFLPQSCRGRSKSN